MQIDLSTTLHMFHYTVSTCENSHCLNWPLQNSWLPPCAVYICNVQHVWASWSFSVSTRVCLCIGVQLNEYITHAKQMALHHFSCFCNFFGIQNGIHYYGSGVSVYTLHLLNIGYRFTELAIFHWRPFFCIGLQWITWCKLWRSQYHKLVTSNNIITCLKTEICQTVYMYGNSFIAVTFALPPFLCLGSNPQLTESPVYHPILWNCWRESLALHCHRFAYHQDLFAINSMWSICSTIVDT